MTTEGNFEEVFLELALAGKLESMEQMVFGDENEESVRSNALEILEAVNAGIKVSEDRWVQDESLKPLLLRVAAVGKPKLVVIGLQTILADTAEKPQLYVLVHTACVAALEVALLGLTAEQRLKIWPEALDSSMPGKLRHKLRESNDQQLVKTCLDGFADLTQGLLDAALADESCKYFLPTLLACIIMDTLESPLASFNIRSQDCPLHAVALRLTGMISRLKLDLVAFVRDSLHLVSEKHQTAPCGLVVAAVFNLEHDLDLVPFVYDISYVMLQFLEVINPMLCKPSTSCLAMHMAFDVLGSILTRMKDGEGVSSDFISASVFDDLLVALTRIISTQENEGVRRAAFSVVSTIHRKAEFGARPLFYLRLMEAAKRFENTSLEGWIASSLKDSVIANLKRLDGPSGGDACQEFAGDGLKRLCRRLVAMELGEQSDILGEKDRLHAAVNFFGCLFAFDRWNRSGIRDLLPQVRANLVEKLSDRLPVAKRCYESDLKSASSPQTGEGGEMSFSIPGDPDETPVDRESYQNYLRACLQAIDIMQYSISRFSFE